jgi:hypothetical protein
MSTSGNFSIGTFSQLKFSGGVLAPAVRFPIGFYVTGKLGKPDVADPLGVYGIYQMRKMKKGKGYVKMKFYTPTNPRTEAQQANRQKFANAMSAWGSLTDEQKQAYIKRAKTRNMFGWGLFIREWWHQN